MEKSAFIIFTTFVLKYIYSENFKVLSTFVIEVESNFYAVYDVI